MKASREAFDSDAAFEMYLTRIAYLTKLRAMMVLADTAEANGRYDREAHFHREAITLLQKIGPAQLEIHIEAPDA